MIEVTIKGFQSIEEVSFSIDGFTALVGRSNIGKSAIVRAIHSALTNATGTDFVRHGSRCSRRIRGTKKCRCQSTVHLQSEGLDLLWEKGDEVSQYTFNGAVYNKMDRGVPDFLLKEFSLVKVGERKVLIQVAEQSDPIFLLNQSGNVVADILSDVAKLDDINVAMTLVEKDRREANSTLKVREKDILGLRTELLQFENLDPAVERTKAVSAALQEIHVQSKRADQLDQFYSRLQTLAGAVRSLRQVDGIVEPDGSSLELAGKNFQDLLRFEQSLQEKTASVDFLSPVEEISAPDDSPLVSGNQLLTKLEEWLAKIAEFKALHQKWKPVDEVKVPSEEYPVQVTQSLLQLSSYSDQLESLTSSVEKLELELGGVDEKELTILSEWTELGICPTCSQSVTPDHQPHLDA